MTEQDQHGAGARGAEGVATGEQSQLSHALETRFAPHVEAAAAAVREAERELTEARERLARAEEKAQDGSYRSDPLVFMRASVDEEVDALDRKTNPKKIRTSYRFLLDRAVELASGEVQGFHDDQTAAQRAREDGLEACREAEQRAVETLEDARAMEERVRAAAESARQGMAIMLEKLAAAE